MQRGLWGGSSNTCRCDRGYLSMTAVVMMFVICVAISFTTGMAVFL